MSCGPRKGHYEIACQSGTRVGATAREEFRGFGWEEFAFGALCGRCEVHRALDKAPHVPIVGTLAVSTFSGALHGGPFLHDGIALRATDLYSKYSSLIPARSKIPRGIYVTFCGAWIRVLGQPDGIRMDVSGEWRNEVSADLSSERRIRSQFQ